MASKKTDEPGATAKVGDRLECFAAELPAVKAALVARLPKGASIQTVSKGGKCVLVVVAA